MAANGSDTAESAALDQQIEGLLREGAALNQALARARAVRLVLFLIVVAFVLVVTYTFYRLGTDLTGEKNLNALADSAQKRLEKNSDKYMAELQKLVDRCSPELTKAFSQQVQKDMPRYFQGMEKERDILARNLEAQFTKTIDDRLEKAMVQHYKLLEEEFPLVKDEEVHKRMMTNMQLAVEKLAKKYYIEELDQQLRNLYDAWDAFPATATTVSSRDVEEQFIQNLLELLKMRLSHTETFVVGR